MARNAWKTVGGCDSLDKTNDLRFRCRLPAVIFIQMNLIPQWMQLLHSVVYCCSVTPEAKSSLCLLREASAAQTGWGVYLCR